MANLEIFEGTIEEYKDLGSAWKKKHGSLKGFLEAHGLIHKSKVPNYKGQGLDDWVKLRNTKTDLGVKVAPYKPESAANRGKMLSEIQEETRLAAKKMELDGLIKKGSVESLLEQFKNQLKLDHRRAKVDRNKAAERWGFPADIGHGTDVKAGGQNIYANLAPEPAYSNQAKQHKQSRPPLDLLESNTPAGKHSQVQAFYTWAIHNAGDEDMTPEMKTRLLHTPENPDIIAADARSRAMGGGSKRVHNVDLDQVIAGDPLQHVAKNSDQRAILKRSLQGWGPGGVIKAATGLNRAESLMRIAGGDTVGGTLGLLMTTPTFQKKAGELLLKRGIHLIPGVSLGAGALQAIGYAAGGQWTKAGISALSGVIGELGPAGDAVSAAMELGLTADDMRQAKKAKGKTGVKPDERPQFEGNKAKRYDIPDVDTRSITRQLNMLLR